MPDTVTGAAQFTALSRRLKDAGETGLRRELYKAISKATRPLMAEIRAGLPDHMPDRYAAVLGGDLALTTQKIATTGIRLKARSHPPRRRKVAHVDAGRLSHPLFGDRTRWFTQPVNPGFFTGPAEKSAPEVRREILAAMRDVAQKITAKG